MAEPRKVLLEDWARAEYGEKPPSIFTLRRWAQAGKFHPPAERHGRRYYVSPNARYVEHGAVTTAAPDVPIEGMQPMPAVTERASTLIDRLIKNGCSPKG